MDRQVLSHLKPLTNDKKALDSLYAYFDENIKIYQLALEKASDHVEVHRLQGSIAALRKLKYMREEANGEQK